MSVQDLQSEILIFKVFVILSFPVYFESPSIIFKIILVYCIYLPLNDSLYLILKIYLEM